MIFQEKQQSAYLDKMVRVKNPTDNQFTIRWDGQPFVLNPQSEEEVPFWLGKHIMRHTELNGKAQVELIEDVTVDCGVCNKQFSTKRELGAHSLVHKKK